MFSYALCFCTVAIFYIMSDSMSFSIASDIHIFSQAPIVSNKCLCFSVGHSDL